MPERVHMDICGNRIEVGDWVVTKGYYENEKLVMGVVTKLCEKTVTIDVFVCDELSPNWGETLRQFHREPRFVCCFQKSRLPDLCHYHIEEE